MQKCSQALGGKCDIRFELERTVFTFWCPAQISDREPEVKVPEAQGFRLPSNVWGIAVDGSKVQRKSLDHFTKTAGIDQARRVVLGATDDEIENSVDYIKEELMLANFNYTFIVMC
jgi:alkyl hydroperoxide reductase subunit AhpC